MYYGYQLEQKPVFFHLILVIILWSKKKILEICDNINKEDFEETF